MASLLLHLSVRSSGAFSVVLPLVGGCFYSLFYQLVDVFPGSFKLEVFPLPTTNLFDKYRLAALLIIVSPSPFVLTTTNPSCHFLKLAKREKERLATFW